MGDKTDSIFANLVAHIRDDGRKASNGTYTAEFWWEGTIFEPFAKRLINFYEKSKNQELADYGEFIESEPDEVIYLEYNPKKGIITFSLLILATTDEEPYEVNVSADFNHNERFSNFRIDVSPVYV